MHLAGDEQAVHESAYIAVSEALLSCADSLRVVDRSITEKGERYLAFVAYRVKSSYISSWRQSTRDNARLSTLYPRTQTLTTPFYILTSTNNGKH